MLTLSEEEWENLPTRDIKVCRWTSSSCWNGKDAKKAQGSGWSSANAHILWGLVGKDFSLAWKRVCCGERTWVDCSKNISYPPLVQGGLNTGILWSFVFVFLLPSTLVPNTLVQSRCFKNLCWRPVRQRWQEVC